MVLYMPPTFIKARLDSREDTDRLGDTRISCGRTQSMVSYHQWAVDVEPMSRVPQQSRLPSPVAARRHNKATSAMRSPAGRSFVREPRRPEPRELMQAPWAAPVLG